MPAGVPVVGNVAALTGHKDHATLVEAMALLRPRCPEARLVIAGEGELRPALEALVRERGLGDRVVFAGFRHDLDRLLPAFSVFCLSSRLEGLGTSLLDAMAFGLPVVATAAGGIPEAVEDGVTGRVAPPRDPAALAEALADVLGDEERRRAYGAAGRRRFLERFTARPHGRRDAARARGGRVKVRAILNPRAGVAAHRTREAVERGRPAWKDYAVYLTREPGHATELAREAVAAGADVVLAVGGDGTVNEVARGLIGSAAALGIVPVGLGQRPGARPADPAAARRRPCAPSSRAPGAAWTSAR